MRSAACLALLVVAAACSAHPATRRGGAGGEGGEAGSGSGGSGGAPMCWPEGQPLAFHDDGIDLEDDLGFVAGWDAGGPLEILRVGDCSPETLTTVGRGLGAIGGRYLYESETTGELRVWDPVADASLTLSPIDVATSYMTRYLAPSPQDDLLVVQPAGGSPRAIAPRTGKEIALGAGGALLEELEGPKIINPWVIARDVEGELLIDVRTGDRRRLLGARSALDILGVTSERAVFFAVSGVRQLVYLDLASGTELGRIPAPGWRYQVGERLQQAMEINPVSDQIGTQLALTRIDLLDGSSLALGTTGWISPADRWFLSQSSDRKSVDAIEIDLGAHLTFACSVATTLGTARTSPVYELLPSDAASLSLGCVDGRPDEEVLLDPVAGAIPMPAYASSAALVSGTRVLLGFSAKGAFRWDRASPPKPFGHTLAVDRSYRVLLTQSDQGIVQTDLVRNQSRVVLPPQQHESFRVSSRFVAYQDDEGGPWYLVRLPPWP